MGIVYRGDPSPGPSPRGRGGRGRGRGPHFSLFQPGLLQQVDVGEQIPAGDVGDDAAFVEDEV
ncbi:MAG: hypothetical protein AB7N70_38395, partial [Dehalococcoidia bacterium]